MLSSIHPLLFPPIPSPSLSLFPSPPTLLLSPPSFPLSSLPVPSPCLSSRPLPSLLSLLFPFHQISKPLRILFNKSLKFGSVPDIWKLANVTSIQKKSDSLLPNNYRPISLTSVVCKLMETIT